MESPIKTVVVLPAYNAAATLAKTIEDIPHEYVDEIILVDDFSTDETIAQATALQKLYPNLVVEQHIKNKGYGGNQKTCYTTALNRGADIVIMLHPDYQYDPKLIKHFVLFIKEDYFNVMLGSRIRTRREALQGGMPLYKYVANRFLTFVQNIASGENLSEWHTGMRAYTRKVLETIDYEKFSDDFIFDTQFLFAVVEHGFSIGEIPVPVRYFKEASSINFSRSMRYGALTLFETALFIFRANRVLRFIAAGGISVLSNLAIYTLLLYTHTWYPEAAILGFWFGGIISFILQKYWTFEKRQSVSLSREIIWYVLLVCVNAFLNSAILIFLVHYVHVGEFTGNIVSNLLVAFVSYFVYRNLIFSSPTTSSVMPA